MTFLMAVAGTKDSSFYSYEWCHNASTHPMPRTVIEASVPSFFQTYGKTDEEKYKEPLIMPLSAVGRREATTLPVLTSVRFPLHDNVSVRGDGKLSDEQDLLSNG